MIFSSVSSGYSPWFDVLVEYVVTEESYMCIYILYILISF